MAESNRAEHQHKVEETPSEAILRRNKLSNNCRATFGRPLGFIALYRQILKCKCRGWHPRQPDFVCSIILAISTQFFLDNLADQCYNKKAEKLRKIE